ncbi:MAG: Spy/CpxP family protein refolding chaperone [Bryobacter sp.]|nr:Spy/CpxP family protein refolding chaperone [Bryobacter sp.]
MTRTKKILIVAAVLVLAAGTVFAQTRGRFAGGARLQMLAAFLDLTESQKTQIRGIIENGLAAAKPVREEMKTNHEAMVAAVKANDAAKIDELAATQGRLAGQLGASHAKNLAQIYQLLTPEQRAKAEKMRLAARERFKERIAERFGKSF